MDNFTPRTRSQGQRPLRILHVGTERGWRGGERQTLWLAQGLTQLGDINIIAARAGEPLAARAADAGIAVVPLAPAISGDPRAVWSLRRAIRAHDIDIVHAHAAHAVTLAALATLGTGVPLVVARRVDFPLKDNAGTRWKYGRAATIVAVSRAVRDVVARAALDVPVVVIPDGTEINRQRNPADAELLESLGVSRGAPLVVQVAQLVAHKDPFTFVHAFAAAHAHMRNIHGLLVGDGPLRADVERRVRALGLTDSLHVVGYRTDADRLLAAADVVTLSSREEGMGSVLLDALVFGRPVAATRGGGIPEVVQDGETGLLVPIGDGDALGAAIVSVLGDPAFAARLSAAARARAPEFSLATMAIKTNRVYHDVLRAARSPA